MSRLSAVLSFATCAAATAFVTPSNLQSNRISSAWTTPQTSSTLQYRTLGNTALVNEYLYIHQTDDNMIAIQSDPSTTSLSAPRNDMLDHFSSSQEYAYEGYSYNNNERIQQLQKVIESMQARMEKQHDKLAEQQAKTKQILLEKAELQVSLKAKEAEYAESMATLLGRFESLELQFETEKQKVIFPHAPVYHQHEAVASTPPKPSTVATASVATVGQIKKWAAQGDQGRALALQALEEGRVQSHRITMSFNQRLHLKDQEIAFLKEQLTQERMRSEMSVVEPSRPSRSASSQTDDMIAWINQMAHIMSNYAKLYHVPSKRLASKKRKPGLFSRTPSYN
ncbi:hypothetical protein MPSEU_000266700 [Mayamaea pseudoterrestris]|nr:hypothetical protein MPSEU_000266700 [Mayamaea pseudoterrestris]